MRMQRQHSGFSLVELVVTIAVIGIAAAVAMPSFTSVFANRRVASSAQDLFATFHYARQEAILRGVAVTVVPIDGDWSNGWQIPTIDIGGNANNPDENLLTRQQQKLDIIEKGGAMSVTFTPPNGRLPGGIASPEFAFCDENLSPNIVKRELTLGLDGKPRLVNNGVNCS